jgi:hypothetical protein
MSWNYSGNPAASSLDEVRYLVGDTQPSDPQLTDEEIAYLLVHCGTPLATAIVACDGLIDKYARLVTQGAGAVSVQYSNRIQQYQELQRRLKLRAPLAPYAGGISVGDKAANEDNTDRVPPSFKRNQFDRRGR